MRGVSFRTRYLQLKLSDEWLRSLLCAQVDASVESTADHLLSQLHAADSIQHDGLTLVRAGTGEWNRKLIKLYAQPDRNGDVLYGPEDYMLREPALTSDLARDSGYFSLVRSGPRGGVWGAATIRAFGRGDELIFELVLLGVDRTRRGQGHGRHLVHTAKKLLEDECRLARFARGCMFALPGKDVQGFFAKMDFAASQEAQQYRDVVYDALTAKDGHESFRKEGIDTMDADALKSALVEWKSDFAALSEDEQRRRYQEGFRWNIEFTESVVMWRIPTSFGHATATSAASETVETMSVEVRSLDESTLSRHVEASRSPCTL